jgi:hypothetical protein
MNLFSKFLKEPASLGSCRHVNKTSWVYKGLMHTVAETILCYITDKNGKRFLVRFLVDSGGSMSLFCESFLPPDGEWDIQDISHRPLKVAGAFKGCEQTSVELFNTRISPREGVNQTGKPDPHIKGCFYVMKDESYPEIKRELPEYLVKKIEASKATIKLADSIVLEKGDEVIKCAGIIGLDMKNAIRTCIIEEFNEKLVVKRSAFGDFISGPTHLVKNERKVRREGRYFDGQNKRFYRTFPVDDNSLGNIMSSKAGECVVPLPVKPGGEFSAGSGSISPSSAELNRIIRDYKQ